MRFQTRAIHGGGRGGDPEEPSRAISFPIYQTSTFGQAEAGRPTVFGGRELCYARTENPTRTALEEALAAVEDAQYAVAFSSGLAAVQATLTTLSSGDHVIACRDLYGGTYRILTKIYSRFGLQVSFVDTTELSNIERALKPNTRMLWLESPSNPLMNVTDLEGAARIARRAGARVVVDNTFATPYLQNPLRLGADVSLHSTTKYVNGHGDAIGGATVVNDRALWDQLKFIQNTTGGVPGPQDCFLVLRGLKTLGVRMERHCRNARRIADALANHPKVERVHYPGLTSHKGHEIARRQMRDFGGMLSFVLRADVDASKRFLSELKIFTLAESLGAVQSLICHPPSMTHASVEPEVRRAAGIEDGLIRVSVGLEDVEDLVEDLEAALATVRGRAKVAS